MGRQKKEVKRCIVLGKTFVGTHLRLDTTTIDGATVHLIRTERLGFILVSRFHFVITFHHHPHSHQDHGTFQHQHPIQRILRSIHFQKCCMERRTFMGETCTSTNLECHTTRNRTSFSSEKKIEKREKKRENNTSRSIHVS